MLSPPPISSPPTPQSASEISATRLLTLATVVSAVALLALSALHYTWHGSDVFHAVVRRLTYLPIALLAVRLGAKGGAIAGAAAALLYAPHAFFPQAFQVFGIHIHNDPSPLVEKVSEVILFVALGTLVGATVDAARRSQTRLSEVEQTLSTTTEELRRAERLSSLGELAAGIAHEVRNPLTALRTTAEVLAEAYPEGHQRHRMAALHLRELDRLDGVVERFLRFARPSAPAVSPQDAAGLLEQAAALLRATAHDAGVTLRVLPVRASVIADEDLTVQALLNLGLNAMQHSPPEATVTIGGEIVDDTVRLWVEDEGPGVREDLREQIFDPCVTTRPEGSGLGLSISSRAIESQGGRLTLESPALDGATGGARFVITLPRELT